MGPASLQVCMDATSDWLQGTAHEDGRMDSSSPSTGDMITCSRPMLEKRLRPPHDQPLKCPRCDSAHTKFCYYNNYSLSQPRYFCKTCRRYWTKGGSLRNIPVGGGCRKNKRVSAKKSSSADQSPNQPHLNLTSHHNMTDLQLSFPELHLSHLNSLLGNNVDLGHSSFMDSTYNSMLDQPMESKYEAILGSHRNHDFGLLGNNVDLGLGGDVNHGSSQLFFHDLSSPYGMPFNANNGGNLMETCQRLMHPFEANDEGPNAIEMKPNKQLLSLEWQDQGCSEVGKDTFRYFTGMGSWNGVMNGYGSSTTNPLV